MYWITDPLIGGFAEKDDGRFVEALNVFSSKAAASEWMRHNASSGGRTRKVSGEELADVLERTSFHHVVVNPLPLAPFGPHPEDVRTVEEFSEGLRG